MTNGTERNRFSVPSSTSNILIIHDMVINVGLPAEDTQSFQTSAHGLSKFSDMSSVFVFLVRGTVLCYRIQLTI